MLVIFVIKINKRFSIKNETKTMSSTTGRDTVNQVEKLHLVLKMQVQRLIALLSSKLIKPSVKKEK